MRFLLKVAFWLSIVVLLLPAGPSKTSDGRAQVGPIEALGVAQAAVEDAREFCTRKPEACEVGSQAFQSFGQKAQHGAKLLYEFLSDRFAENASPAVTGETRGNARDERPGRHTLKPEDLAPRWDGPDRKAVPVPPRRPV